MIMLTLLRDCRNETPTYPKGKGRNPEIRSLRVGAKHQPHPFVREADWTENYGEWAATKNDEAEHPEPHYCERDANGKQETENIGNETDGQKNVGVGEKERWVRAGRLTKQVNSMATWDWVLGEKR